MAQKSERKERRPLLNSTWLAWLCAPLLTLCAQDKAVADTLPQVNIINRNTPVLLAQGVTTPGILPTDATKGALMQDRANIYPGFKLRLFQRLPARLVVQGSCEVNQRLDTNVFLQYKEPQPDYVFRVAPNLLVGYNVKDSVMLYTSYFVIKDVYTVHHRQLTPPTTQSIAMGARYTLPPMLKNKLSIYLDGQARELFQSRGLRQADLTPTINATYFANQKMGFFGSATMQMRSGQLFLGPQREIDCFYTLGGWWRTLDGKWVVSFNDTFVTNFREPHFKYSIPKQGNVNMIADLEIDRQIGNITGLQAFIRAEPVWNWRSNNLPGLSGFDFRLYSGLRYSFYKQNYGATMNAIRNSLKQQDDPNNPKNQPKPAKKKGKGKNADPSTAPAADPTKKDGDTTPGSSDPNNTSKNSEPSADPNILPMISPSAALGPASPTASPAVAGTIIPVSSTENTTPSVVPAQKTALETQEKTL